MNLIISYHVNIKIFLSWSVLCLNEINSFATKLSEVQALKLHLLFKFD